jgi:hypothetical protein
MTMSDNEKDRRKKWVTEDDDIRFDALPEEEVGDALPEEEADPEKGA